VTNEKPGNIIKQLTMNKETQKHIDELEEKLARQHTAIESYCEQLKKLTDYKSERDLYSELSAVFAFSSNFDEVFVKTLDAISLHLKASYYGIFWLDERKENFLYRHGKGYNPSSIPALHETGSLMGDCLFKKEVLWEPRFRSRTDVVALNQIPEENNVLCSPVILENGDEGVIRLANIDPVISEKAKSIMWTLTRLLCSALDRLSLHARNEKTLRSLDVSFAIARLLEDTLNKQDILKKVCSEAPRLLPCAGCVLALREANGAMVPVMSWPENFILAANKASGSIYLQNLIEAFPSGSGLIADIHRNERRWSWPAPTIKSLCMAPIRIRNQLEGVIILLGPPEETYDKSHENLLGLVAAQTSMTLERASYFQRQEDLARLDGLTGLNNHRTFQESIREEINRTRRYGRSLSLIMLDIDHFKKFNDTYGHPVGDEVIKMVAKTIKTMIRGTDRAFRYGGEEFTIILPETPGKNGIILAERLRQFVEQNRSVKNLTITISLGITELTQKESPESFIKRSDDALYAAKEGGRNRVVMLTP
jgi:diguanylate cyclase (GGDEF)-like protein